MENKEWFLYVVDRQEGPFSQDEIEKKLKSGQAKMSSFVWKQGYEDWAMLSDAPEFGGRGTVLGTEGHGPTSFSLQGLRGFGGLGDGGGQVHHKDQPDLGGVLSSESVWCLNSRKTFTGPHSLKTLIRKINDGEVSIQDSIWKEGWSGFVPMHQIQEVVSQIKPDVLDGGGKLKKKGSLSPAAIALGLDGAGSTRSYKWYRTTSFFILMLVVFTMAFYHATAKGSLNWFYDLIQVRAKVESLKLEPLPVELAVQLGTEAVTQVNRLASPVVVSSFLSVLPAPLKAWFSGVDVPEGIPQQNADLLREVALSDLKSGVKIASALPIGDELNPRFFLTSNIGDGGKFKITLKGKEGTLLNVMNYERSIDVIFQKHVAQTDVFRFENSKPLPKGEYILLAESSDVEKLSAPKILNDSYFLGGKKDSSYQTRLKDYNERLKSKSKQELEELKQAILTFENLANEGAVKYFSVIKLKNGVQRKTLWTGYQKDFAKIFQQLSGIAGTASIQEPKLQKRLYDRLLAVQQEIESLHQIETDVIMNGAQSDLVQVQAQKTAHVISDLKQEIFKLLK